VSAAGAPWFVSTVVAILSASDVLSLYKYIESLCRIVK
jgi:hypothetical protein